VTTEDKAHETTTSMVQAPLTEVPGCADMALKVKVSCTSGCDLWGGAVKIIAQDGAAVKEAVLISFDGNANETDEFMVKAPFGPGEYTWTALFPAQERGGASHGESSALFSFIVQQHTLDIDVWDLPPAIAIGADFRIKVGVMCSSGCSLAGQQIEIYDPAGTIVATGTLADQPWPEMTTRYWTEVQLAAPAKEGRYRWEVRFPTPDLELPHEETAHALVFAAARQAQHLLTIEVVEKDTQAPIQGAHLRLRPRRYRGSAYMTDTDGEGMARLHVPKGDYQLYIWDERYEKIMPLIQVDSDLVLKAELSARVGSWREFPH